MGALFVITIGIDPHKASLTAVAVDASGTPLGHRRLLVNAGTLSQLVAWAAGWPIRRFAVEGAYGLGRPIAQQLAAAGEQVLDVPATLAARARLLSVGGGRKTDAADAASVAQVALHWRRLRTVAAEDQTTSCGCWPSVATTWLGSAPASSTGSTACCGTSSRVAPPPTCRRPKQLRCCAACARRPRPPPAAGSWPATCLLTCDASMRD
jgi:Transposase